MPVLNWRTGETGFGDDYTRARLPKPKTVVNTGFNPWTIQQATRSSVELDKKKNPTQSPTRVYRGLFPNAYRPGGILYRP